jgi:hypothetical protein
MDEWIREGSRLCEASVDEWVDGVETVGWVYCY